MATLVQDVFVTLFSPIVDSDVRFDLDLNKFGRPEPDNVVIYEPARLILLDGRAPPAGSPSKEVRYSLPWPSISVRIAPYPISKTDELTRLTSALPTGFDTRDGLGTFALRAGPGLSTTRRVATNTDSPVSASALMHIRFTQDFPETVSVFLGTGAIIEPQFTDSLLDSLRLLSGGDTLEYKAFMFINDRLVDYLIRWSLSAEIAPRIGKILPAQSQDVANFAALCLAVRMTANKQKGSAVVLLALQQLFTASITADTSTSFLLLMTAYEALFADETDYDKGGRVAKRLGNLLGVSKQDAGIWQSFMWDSDPTSAISSCRRVRNAIAHGRIQTPPAEMLQRLDRAIRLSILGILQYWSAGTIDRGENYYSTLEQMLEQRFNSLPST